MDTARIYINGVLANMTTFNDIANTGAGRNLTYDVFIGVLGGASPSRPFVGRIDEVTTSKVTRDSNWIKLAYQNQKPGNSLVDIGTYVAPVVPSAPTGVTAVKGTGNTAINVSWVASSSDGGSAITQYTATSAPGGLTCIATAPATTCTVEGVTGSTSYTFTVVATNSVGNSLASAPSGAIVSLLPKGFVIHLDATNPYSYRIPAAALASTEQLTMTVVDMHGKRLWSRTINPAKSKVAELTWDGRNTSGARVSAGIYIVRINMKAAGASVQLDQKGLNLKP